MLPVDLILVRHGQSEENLAISMDRSGDKSYFTYEFRRTHDRAFRLTDKGVAQSKAVGEWLKKNAPVPFDYFYVSDFIRAKETALCLGLPQAGWQVKYELRERDQGYRDKFPANLSGLDPYKYPHDEFLSYPPGGGESFATLCLRAKTGFIDDLEHNCLGHEKVIGVSHGYYMRAIQSVLENLSREEFIRLNESQEPADRIFNGQIHWYSRRDSDTLKVESSRMVAVRSVCVSDEVGDYGWRRIESRLRSDQDLMDEVSKYPSLLKG